MNITNMHTGQLPNALEGMQWALHARNNTVPSLPGQPIPASLVPTLVGIQYNDEQNLGDPAILADTTAKLAQFRDLYPNALSYTNQGGPHLSISTMRNYMSIAKPDMLCFDTYPFRAGPYPGGSPTPLYRDLQKYRDLAVGGNDGTGSRPIPYGTYVQSYARLDDTPASHVVSQSEINLSYFAAWAFGNTLTNVHTYDRASESPYNSILFEGGETAPTEPSDYSNPTPQYYQFAEVNRESQNLGPTLVRLISTDVRMVMGLHKEGITWDSSADPYVTYVSSQNYGSTNDGLRGDNVIGYFKPLEESFDGDEYENEIYFMIVNGLTDPNGSGEDCRRTIKIEFDFGASGIDSLQRLNRTTGNVEIVNLESLGGSQYRYEFDLDGGKGDLFKFNTGSPFIQMPEPATICVLGIGALGILARRRKSV